MKKISLITLLCVLLWGSCIGQTGRRDILTDFVPAEEELPLGQTVPFDTTVRNLLITGW